MKPSHILLIVIVFITLTGMGATDVLLKQQYNRIDWRNPYQQFEKRGLPAARHWIIEGTPRTEIMVLESAGSSQAMIDPDYTRFYRIRQRGDTAVILFTPDAKGYQNEPRSDADYEYGVQLVLRLPALHSLQIKNGRVTLSSLKKDSLRVTLQHSRLRTTGAGGSASFSLVAGQSSFATLGPGHYQSLRAIVQDSSGIWLNDTRIDAFTVQASPRAEIQLKGQAIKWVR